MGNYGKTMKKSNVLYQQFADYLESSGKDKVIV
jgi:hypothetical protein